MSIDRQNDMSLVVSNKADTSNISYINILKKDKSTHYPLEIVYLQIIRCYNVKCTVDYGNKTDYSQLVVWAANHVCKQETSNGLTHSNDRLHFRIGAYECYAV